MGIDDDDAIFPFKRSFGRTNGDTAWVVTMIAEDWKKGFSHIRIVPLFNLFDPGWPNAEGDPVLHLAGYFTGMTTDAPA